MKYICKYIAIQCYFGWELYQELIIDFGKARKCCATEFWNAFADPYNLSFNVTTNLSWQGSGVVFVLDT